MEKVGSESLRQRNAFDFPPEIIDQLIQLSTDSSENAWAVGDICVDIIDEFSAFAPKGDIRRMIAEKSKLSPETIREREWAARRIPEKERVFTPLLYSQYRACLSAGDDWRVYAQWAVESMDEYGGNPPSVSVIRAHIRGNGDNTPSWKRRLDRMIGLCDDMINDEKAPDPVRSGAKDALRILASLGSV